LDKSDRDYQIDQVGLVTVGGILESEPLLSSLQNTSTDEADQIEAVDFDLMITEDDGFPTEGD
jgi:hypothetical protein